MCMKFPFQNLSQNLSDDPARRGEYAMHSIVLAALLSIVPVVAVAEPPDVMTLVKQVKAAFEPSQPTVRKVEISLHAENKATTWHAAQAFKPTPAGNQMLTVLLEPAEIRANAFVVREQAEEVSGMWIYSPLTRRVREFVPVDAYERFLGTDFTYADSGLIRLHEHYRLLDKEQHHGVQAYKIEEQIKGQRHYYSRIFIWVTTDSMLPLEREYFDLSEHIWKRERFWHGAGVHGLPSLLRTTMEDVQAKTWTSLIVTEERVAIPIPDEVFDPKKLPTVASHPIWLTPVTAGPHEQ